LQDGAKDVNFLILVERHAVFYRGVPAIRASEPEVSWMNLYPMISLPQGDVVFLLVPVASLAILALFRYAHHLARTTIRYVAETDHDRLLS
jgi:hypothetical protein